MANEAPTTRRLRLSQETLAIVTVGVALATLLLTSVHDLRSEARADRAAWQEESRQLRDKAAQDQAAWQEESRQLRNEAVQDFAIWQEENRRWREKFEAQILRLTENQTRLGEKQAQLGADLEHKIHDD